jgi:hypothetical protein
VLGAGLDGSYTAMTISLPASSELVDAIPGADPLLLYQVGACVASLVLQHSHGALRANGGGQGAEGNTLHRLRCAPINYAFMRSGNGSP